MAKPDQVLPRRSADDLRYWLALMLELEPNSPKAKSIAIVPMNDSWRAMSGRHDDDPQFRSDVIRRSIELAEQYDLER